MRIALSLDATCCGCGARRGLDALLEKTSAKLRSFTDNEGVWVTELETEPDAACQACGAMVIRVRTGIGRGARKNDGASEGQS